jgi:hypothetical protein
MAQLHGNELQSGKGRAKDKRRDTNLAYNTRFRGNSIKPGLLSNDIVLYALGRFFILLDTGNGVDTCGELLKRFWCNGILDEPPTEILIAQTSSVRVMSS